MVLGCFFIPKGSKSHGFYGVFLLRLENLTEVSGSRGVYKDK